MSAIEIRSLKKSYGKHIGISDVSFSVGRGEIFGFVGPNGAGKSTTIKILMGFIYADSGTAGVLGHDVGKEIKQIKERTGYVPSDVRLYPEMYVRELLARKSDFYREDLSSEAKRLSELFGLDTGKRFKELSTGNKKKVSIVCALMSKPSLIILDEPTNGLDPVMQKALFSELSSQTKNGASVLLSSHNLTEVQEYCDRVAFIKKGRILNVIDMHRQTDNYKIVSITGGQASLPSGLELLSSENEKRVLRTQLGARQLLEALSAINPADFTVENESMEEHFWKLYAGEGQL